MFTDVVRSTELFASLGEDLSDQLRRRLFATLGRAVSGNGGVEVKRLGDGVFATFESATEAVSAAVAVQRSIEDRRSGSSGLSTRIGISSGDVHIDGTDRLGEAVTEASRLCSAAAGGEILITETVRALMRGRGGHGLIDVGALSLKGLPRPVVAVRVEWRHRADRRLAAVIADDAVLVREGVARLLEDNGITVAAQVGDADELMKAVERCRPDLVITDIRMPPTHTLEGLEAAVRIRSEHSGVGVLVLSQHIGRSSARRLVESEHGSESGVGYLLKERVGDVDEFIDVVRRVAAGEQVIDPELSGRSPGQSACL